MATYYVCEVCGDSFETACYHPRLNPDVRARLAAPGVTLSPSPGVGELIELRANLAGARARIDQAKVELQAEREERAKTQARADWLDSRHSCISAYLDDERKGHAKTKEALGRAEVELLTERVEHAKTRARADWLDKQRACAEGLLKSLQARCGDDGLRELRGAALASVTRSDRWRSAAFWLSVTFLLGVSTGALATGSIWRLFGFALEAVRADNGDVKHLAWFMLNVFGGSALGTFLYLRAPRNRTT